MSADLLPCPMCNGEANVIEMDDYFMAHCECGINYEGPTADDCVEAWNRRVPLPAEQPSNPVPHGHREDYYLMANGRRLAEQSIARVKRMSNWVLATQLFATGSASAHQICHEAGIDPDAYTVARIVGQQTKGGGNG